MSGIQEQLSWVVLAQEVAVKMLAGLWSHLKGWLTGAGGPISKRADTHVCWQEAQFLTTGTALVSPQHGIWLSPEQGSKREEAIMPSMT